MDLPNELIVGILSCLTNGEVKIATEVTPFWNELIVYHNLLYIIDLPNELVVGVLSWLTNDEIKIATKITPFWNELIVYHNLLRGWAVDVIERYRRLKLGYKSFALQAMNYNILRIMDGMMGLTYSV